MRSGKGRLGLSTGGGTSRGAVPGEDPVASATSPTKQSKKTRRPCPQKMPKSREMQNTAPNTIYGLRQKKTVGSHRPVSLRRRKCQNPD